MTNAYMISTLFQISFTIIMRVKTISNLILITWATLLLAQSISLCLDFNFNKILIPSIYVDR